MCYNLTKDQKVDYVKMRIRTYARQKYWSQKSNGTKNNVLPGIKTYEEGVRVYRQWYKEEDAKVGVVGISLKVIK